MQIKTTATTSFIVTIQTAATVGEDVEILESIYITKGDKIKKI